MWSEGLRMGSESRTDPDGWAAPEADPYDLAKHALRALIAAYTSRIEAAAPGEVPALLSVRGRYAAELRTLDAGDNAKLAQIITEYPALIQRVRSDPGVYHNDITSG